MALDDKNILITPNTGTANEPKIEFTGADASGNDTITLSASYDGNVSTLSFEASTGQLFSVANIDSDGDGYSFSINDNSGIPAVLVELDGTIQLNPNTGNVLIGTATDDGQNVLQVNGNTKLTGDVSGITDLYIDDQIISTGDTNTYLQFHAADQFRIVAGGSERFEVTNVSPHILITGNLKVQGNIEATGTLDTTGQNDLSVSDKKITLNDGEVGPGVGGAAATGETAVSGIYIDRGPGQDSASLVYNDASGADRWEARSSNGVLGPLSASVLTGNLDWSYIQSKPAPVVTVTLTGDVTGTGNTTLTDLASGTISFATTIAANSVALGTDTTGNYVATIAAGTPGTETSSSGLTIVAAAGEGTAATIAHADTSSQGSVDNSGNTFIQDITLDTYGHITGITSATTSIGNATITLTAGTDLSTGGNFTTNATANKEITFNHSAIGHTVTSGSGLTPSYGGSFTILDSVQVSNQGHVTNYRTRSVTIPASDNTNTTYTLSTETIQSNPHQDSATIRLTAGGSGSGTQDIKLITTPTNGTDGLLITESGSTITIKHADTSSVSDLSSDNANGVVLQDISFTFDTYGHTTAASVATTDLDTRYIRSFQVEDGDGTEVTINQANEWKFVEGAGTGASIDINWTDTSNGTDADPYDLTFTVTNTDRGSSQNIFKTLTVTDTDTGYSWSNTGTITANLNNDSATFVSGTEINFDVDTTKGAIRANHIDVTRTDTTSTAAPAYGGTFTVIDSLSTNARGHVTAANVKTVTVPASDNTNTTYSISTEPGADAFSEKIRLTAGGSGSGTDDIVLAVAKTGDSDGLDISESGDTITFAHHDTSTIFGKQGTAGISSIEVDGMGHVIGVTPATYNNYSHPTQSAIDVNATDNGVNVIDRVVVNTLGHVTSVTTRNLSAATSTASGVVSTGAQEFGGVKTFKSGSIILDNAAAPSLVFNYVPADSAISAAESLGKISFQGSALGGTGPISLTDISVEIRANAYSEWNTGTDTTDAPGELSVWVVRNGTDTLYETLTINQAEVVVNEDGQDVDFRVEGSGSQTASFFVTGSNGNVGIGTNSPVADLTIYQNTPTMRFTNTATSTDWDTGDLLSSVTFDTESQKIVQLDVVQTLDNQNVPNGGLVIRTGSASVVQSAGVRTVIDHLGSTTMVYDGGETALTSLLSSTGYQPGRNLTLMKYQHGGSGVPDAFRGAATLLGMGSSVDGLSAGIDSDVFSIFGLDKTSGDIIDTPQNYLLGKISFQNARAHLPGDLWAGNITFSTSPGAPGSTPPTVLEERMRIDYSGRVGIGTNAPEQKLHIVDTSNPGTTTGSVIIEGRRDGPANVLELRARDASAPTTALPGAQGPVMRFTGFDGTDFEEMAYIYAEAEASVADGDAPSSLVFGTTSDAAGAASTKMVIKSSGFVGVGSTNPDQKFVIQQSVNGSATVLAVQNAYSASSSIDESVQNEFRFYNTTSTAFASGATIRAKKTEDWASNNNASAQLEFWTRKDNSLTQKMTITDGGAVGIGSTQPSALLDVSGRSVISGQDALTLKKDLDASEPQLRLQTTGDGYSKTWAIGQLVGTEDFGLSYFNGSTWSEKLRADSNGRVGIGTNAPLTPLHVESTDDLFATIKSTKADGQAQVSFVNDARQYNVGVNNLDKFDIYDLTAAASRFTINTSGNIGIGTNNPARLLTVSGTGGTLLSLVSTDNDNCQVMFGDAASDTIGKIVYAHGDDHMRFETAGIERMRINSSGQISVTSSAGLIEDAVGVFLLPSGELRVKDNTENGTSQISIYNINTTNDTEQFFVAMNGGNVEMGNRRTADLKFFTNNVEHMSIAADGSVVFRSDFPSIQLTDTNGTNAAAFIQAGDGNLSFYADDNNTNANSFISFWNNGFQKMVIDSDGKVGIGTNNPKQILDIDGRNILLDDYTAVGRVSSSAASIFGHNAVADTTNNQVVAGNSGWNSHFMRMYYDEGIAFHVSNTNTGTSGDVLHDWDTPSNKVSYCNEAMRIDIGGRVGIGTTYVTSRLHLKTVAPIANTVNDVLTIETYRADVTAFNGGAIVFRNGDTNSAGQARIKVGSANDASIGLNEESSQSFIFEVGKGQQTESSSISAGGGSYVTVVHSAWPNGGLNAGDVVAVDDGAFLGSYTVTTVSSSTQFTAVDRLGRDLTGTTTDTNSRTWFTTYPLNAMIIRADGNVGIGLVDPSDKFEVQAAGNDDGIRLKGSGGDNLIWMHQQNTDGAVMRMYENGITNIVLNTDGNQRARFNGTNGSYVSWEYNNGITMADIGNGNQVFGSNGKINDFGITCRIGKLLFGSNGTNVDMMLDSSSDLHVLGDIIAFSTTLSDQRLKNDVETLDKSLEKILQLRGVSFTWNAGSREGVRDIGVIAQEVETVIPEIVREKKAELIDGLPTKTVDYEKLVAVLIEGMKEQQAQIDELREEIQALKRESK